MSYHIHDDRIEYRADTIMRRTEYWVVATVVGMAVLMAVVVWALV